MDNDTSGWRHAIETCDSIMEVHGCTLEESMRCFSVFLNPEQICNLLTEAAAPKPWRDLQTVVGRIDRHYPVQERGASEEVRKAIAKLRRYLPEVIGEPLPLKLININTPLAGRLLGMAMAQRVAMSRLLTAAEAAAFYWAPTKGPAAHWHYDAQVLLDVYRAIVIPDGGISPDGPAVRFVQSALKHLTQRTHERDAIESALRAMERPR
jgi:hypothetical protein